MLGVTSVETFERKCFGYPFTRDKIQYKIFLENTSTKILRSHARARLAKMLSYRSHFTTRYEKVSHASCARQTWNRWGSKVTNRAEWEPDWRQMNQIIIMTITMPKILLPVLWRRIWNRPQQSCSTLCFRFGSDETLLAERGATLPLRLRTIVANDGICRFLGWYHKAIGSSSRRFSVTARSQEAQDWFFISRYSRSRFQLWSPHNSSPKCLDKVSTSNYQRRRWPAFTRRPGSFDDGHQQLWIPRHWRMVRWGWLFMFRELFVSSRRNQGN